MPCCPQPRAPVGVDPRNFYFAIALLDQSYWILGSVIGAVAGALIPFSTEGVDFAMTALFVVIAVDQWRSYRRHLPAVLGAGVTVLFLIVLGHFFGQDQMLLISLGVIVLCLLVLRDRLTRRRKRHAEHRRGRRRHRGHGHYHLSDPRPALPSL